MKKELVNYWTFNIKLNQFTLNQQIESEKLFKELLNLIDETKDENVLKMYGNRKDYEDQLKLIEKEIVEIKKSIEFAESHVEIYNIMNKINIKTIKDDQKN